MKIIQANNNHRIIGGSDTVFMNTGQLLQRNGHEVTFFAARDPEDEPDTAPTYSPRAGSPTKARIADLPRYLRNGDAARSMRALLHDTGPYDIAHLHIYYGRLTAAILPELRRKGVPIVQTLHEYKLACPVHTMERNGRPCRLCIDGSTVNALSNRCKDGSLLRSAIILAEHWASRLQGNVRLIDRFICVSHFQRRIMVDAGLPPEKLEILHNFVDVPNAPVLSAAERGGYALYFGRIAKLKGLSTLVHAARETGIPTVIAGTGPYAQELRAEIADIPNVTYVGFKSGPALARLVREARTVIVPSEWYENCPMSVLEAKAAGTPVIATRIGGMPELVRDGTDGILFEPGKADDLAAAITSLDDARLDRMAIAAREDVVARFSATAHLSALTDIYRDAIGAARTETSPHQAEAVDGCPN